MSGFTFREPRSLLLFTNGWRSPSTGIKEKHKSWISDIDDWWSKTIYLTLDYSDMRLDELWWTQINNLKKNLHQRISSTAKIHSWHKV